MPKVNSSNPRPPRRVFIMLTALLFGALGGLFVNWQVIANIFGLIPGMEQGTIIHEIKRENTVEISSFTETANLGKSAVLPVISANDIDKVKTGDDYNFVGSALCLSDDGLFLLLDKAAAPDDVAILTIDGYILPLTKLGADPWSGRYLASVNAKNIPVGQIKPFNLSLEPPQIGQRLIGISAENGYSVHSAVVSSLESITEVDDIPNEKLFITPKIGEANIYVDLGGSVIAIGLEDDNVLSGSSLSSLLATYQRTQQVIRPDFGLKAHDTLPGFNTLSQTTRFSAKVTELLPESAYQKSGGLVGDVILAINGRELSSEFKIINGIVRQQPIASVDFRILRGSEEITLTVTTGKI